jgi:hypothetical protein
MPYFMRISALATIDALNHKSLLEAWRIYGGPGTLVKSFTVEKPLTPAQLRRLPAELRALLN